MYFSRSPAIITIWSESRFGRCLMETLSGMIGAGRYRGTVIRVCGDPGDQVKPRWSPRFPRLGTKESGSDRPSRKIESSQVIQSTIGVPSWPPRPPGRPRKRGEWGEDSGGDWVSQHVRGTSPTRHVILRIGFPRTWKVICCLRWIFITGEAWDKHQLHTQRVFCKSKMWKFWPSH